MYAIESAGTMPSVETARFLYCRPVPVEEASVIIAVSSPHRRSAIEAVDYCIDTLKSTVPIWKKVGAHH